MSTVPGPIIRFQIDTPGLSAAVGPAMQQIRDQTKATTAAIADEWKRTAAQIRASIATGTSTQREMTAEQQRLVALLDRQISSLRQRNELTNKELANLKAMTLERERQADAIKRGVGVGVTSGTTSALGQVSTQAALGIERVLDSLVNRYFGGAAGAAVRTVRDVGYYSAQASGTTGGSGTIFGLSGTSLGLLGGAGAIALATAGIVKMADSGGKLAVELQNLSSKTGLTVENVIKLRSASETLDVDFDRVVTGFRKFSQETTLALTGNLPGASKQAKEAAELFKILGVDIKKAASDPFSAITQLSKALSALPDGAVKTATAVELFGRGGLELLPILDRLTPSIDATSKSAQDLARALGVDVAHSADALKAQLVNAQNEFEALEVTLAKNVLPALVSVVSWFNNVADAAKHYVNQYGDEKSLLRDQLSGQVRAHGQELTGYGNTQVNKFIDSLFTRQRGDIGTIDRLYGGTNVQKTYDSFVSFLGSGGQAAIEKYGTALKQSAKQATSAAQKNAELAQNLGKTSKALDLTNIAEYQNLEVTAKGSLAKGQLVVAEKELQRAIASGNDQASRGYAQQVASLEKIIKLENRRQEVLKSYYSEGINRGPSTKDERLNDELDKLLAGTNQNIARDIIKNLPLGQPSPLGPNLRGLATGVGKDQVEAINEEYKKVIDDLIGSTQKARDRIKETYDEELKYWEIIQKEYPQYAQEASDAIIRIKQTEANKIIDLYKSQADSLFEDLISGKGKSFAKAFEKDIEDIVLAPFKEQFEKIIGTIFGGIDQGVSGAPSSAASGGGSAITKILTKVFGGTPPGVANPSVFTPNTPGGTAGYFPGSLGPGKTSASGSVAIQTGQTGVSTPTMYVQAQVVNISGGGTGTSGGLGIPGIPGASNFFGNNNPFSGSFGFFGNNSPVGGGTSAGGGLFGGLLGQLAGPLILGGLSARSGNTSGEAIAAGSVAGTLASKLIPGALGKTLGGVLPGVGTVAAGISQGGLGGGLEDVAGGAQIGTAIAPGIGTAIGAGVGALIGIINGIIGAGGWQNNVKNAMRNQAIYLPPSENFSFASNGSISSTLGTGFSTSGNTLSQYGLGNTPFYASAIYGPLTNAQKLQLQQTELGLNSNSPFLGGSTAPDPFTGERIPGYLPYPTSPPPYVGNTPLGYLPGRSGSNVVVQLSLPGYIDGQSAQAALGPHVNWIAQKVALQVNSSASGFGNNVRRAAYLP